MARTVTQIQQQILDSVAADSVLSPLLTSTSKRAIYRLWAFITAVAINLLEQLQDILKSSVEATAATAAPATPSWVQAQVLKFQYSSTTPQVLQMINFVPTYPTVDATLRIVSRCSVTTTLSNQVLVKVATGEPPAALTTDQLNALRSYIADIGIAGVNYVVTSTPADLLSIRATIYYQGQFAGVIKTNVIAAIRTFLSSIPFNGKMKITDLQEAILAVQGVNDVLFDDVRARDNATPFADGTYLVQNQLVISRQWSTISGYMVEETTVGETFDDTLTFTAE